MTCLNFPFNPDFDFVVKDFLPWNSDLTFPAVLEDECSLSVVSNLTAVTNDQVKLLATPGIAAVSSSLVAENQVSIKRFNTVYAVQQSLQWHF